MKNRLRLGCRLWVLLILCVPPFCAAQKIAITFDDLPLNGELPPGVTKVEIAKDTVAILKKWQLPPAYGFINAKRLEDSQDGADALKLWASAEPVGNHTYSHLDLNQNTTDAFEREIAENEPALELLDPSVNWHWLRYPFLREGGTLEKRNAVRDYLKAHGYKVAQVTMEWGDYFWNTAYARCSAKNDVKGMDWLRTSYLNTESAEIDHFRELSKIVFGRDINYVLLLHLGSFSSTILPEAFALLKKKGFEFVTLQEAESDAAYAIDPAEGALNGGTFLDQLMNARKLTYPSSSISMPQKPEKELADICR
jgi:peptidoglycan/xylan/chitin deacetylase (PgdA/CDA1 family)